MQKYYNIVLFCTVLVEGPYSIVLYLLPRAYRNVTLLFCTVLYFLLEQHLTSLFCPCSVLYVLLGREEESESSANPVLRAKDPFSLGILYCTVLYSLGI